MKERLISDMRYENKSTLVIILTLLLTVMFTGCAIGLGASKGVNDASASLQAMQEPSSAMPMQTSAVPDSASSAQAPLSSQSKNSGSIISNSSTQQSLLTQIEEALNTKVPLMLTTSIPIANNHYLTATTASQATDYKVNFYEIDQAAKINSQAASNGTLIASLEGTEYKDAESAKECISAAGYETVDLSSVDSNAIVDLGHQIKAVQDAGLGHQMLAWNEGRWCLHVDSPTDSAYQDKEYPDNKQLAKNVVVYLENNMLPAPQKIGIVSINIWYQNHDTTIEWQDNQTVYQITSQDPMTALKIAVEMKAVNQKAQK